jgi:hypothetical protein
MLKLPPLNTYPEVKSVGAALTLADVLSKPQFVLVRKQMLSLARAGKLIPPRS